MKQRSAQIVTDPTIVLISRRGQNSQISGVHETDERTGKVEYRVNCIQLKLETMLLLSIYQDPVQ